MALDVVVRLEGRAVGSADAQKVLTERFEAQLRRRSAAAVHPDGHHGGRCLAGVRSVVRIVERDAAPLHEVVVVVSVFFDLFRGVAVVAQLPVGVVAVGERPSAPS